MEQSRIDEIVREVARRFPTFGSGSSGAPNPIAQALEDHGLQFAMGVGVREVVQCVISEVEKG